MNYFHVASAFVVLLALATLAVIQIDAVARKAARDEIAKALAERDKKT